MGLDWIITEETHIETIRGKYVLAQLERCELLDENMRNNFYEDTIDEGDIHELIAAIEKLIDEMKAQTPLAHNMEKDDDLDWDAFFEEEIEYFTEVNSYLFTIVNGDGRVMSASY
tara:strand:+ start:11105 stop:11449 length:345 start_codon:yes stop_codon:yes gene_type:complete